MQPTEQDAWDHISPAALVEGLYQEHQQLLDEAEAHQDSPDETDRKRADSYRREGMLYALAAKTVEAAMREQTYRQEWARPSTPPAIAGRSC